MTHEQLRKNQRVIWTTQGGLKIRAIVINVPVNPKFLSCAIRTNNGMRVVRISQLEAA